MICSNCGKEIEGGKFCPFCGTAVAAPEAPATETPAEEAKTEVSRRGDSCRSTCRGSKG